MATTIPQTHAVHSHPRTISNYKCKILRWTILFCFFSFNINHNLIKKKTSLLQQITFLLQHINVLLQYITMHLTLTSLITAYLWSLTFLKEGLFKGKRAKVFYLSVSRVEHNIKKN